MSGNNRIGRTRKTQKLSLDGMVNSVETSFAERPLTVGVSPLSNRFFGEDICLFECNLGAIETSVFVERRSAFFFDGGSSPAAKKYEKRKIQS